MRRAITLLLLATALTVGAQETTATYTEACDRAWLEADAAAAIDRFVRTADIDRGTDGALASIEALQAELDAIHADCIEEQRAARVDDLTALLTDLYAGGHILYVRHTHTDRDGSGDTLRLDCGDQRNLSTRGRREAAAINPNYTALALPISEVVSTELCRNLDTTELAFGPPDTVIPRTELEVTLADLLTVTPPPGQNQIIVGHIGTLDRNFGLPLPFNEGDTYVFRPTGEGTVLVGRISLQDWEILPELASP